MRSIVAFGGGFVIFADTEDNLEAADAARRLDEEGGTVAVETVEFDGRRLRATCAPIVEIPSLARRLAGARWARVVWAPSVGAVTKRSRRRVATIAMDSEPVQTFVWHSDRTKWSEDGAVWVDATLVRCEDVEGEEP